MAIAGSASFTEGWERPPDIARSLRAMAIGRAQLQVRTLPGLVVGRCDGAQIAEGPDGRIAVFDGRLHDRGAVATALGAEPGTSDSGLVLLAYRRCGELFADRLVGDFACAIWDPAAKHLLLARDSLGAVPLCFWRSGDTVYFASEPRGLFAQPDVPRQLDEVWIARWLAMLPADSTRTEYRDIERVTPGHVVRHHAGGSVVQRHWRPENLSPLRLANDGAYVERLRELLDAAVGDRIAGFQVVGSHLSGGLDSSAVTATAARILGQRGRRLAAFTAVPTHDFITGPHTFGDEGPLATATAATLANVDHILVPNSREPLFDTIDRANAAGGSPVLNPYNQTWFDGIGSLARDRGVNILLTGQHGNTTISYEGLTLLPRLLSHGRWLRLAREARGLRRNGDMTWLTIADLAAGWLLPSPVRKQILAARGHAATRLADFSLLEMGFADRIGLAEEAMATAGSLRNRRMHGVDIRVVTLQRIDLARNFRAFRRQFGVALADPTADRRVVEFCLAIPQEQFLRDGTTRWLARRAFRGILPDAVVNEKRRGRQAADWHVPATAARPEMEAELKRLERSPLARECLDLGRMRRLLDAWPTEGWHTMAVRNPYQLALTRALATGRFIRSVEGGNE